MPGPLGITQPTDDDEGAEDFRDMFVEEEEETPAEPVEVVGDENDPAVDDDEGELIGPEYVDDDDEDEDEEPEGQLLAGQFSSPVELERAYGEVRRAFTQAAQDNARTKAELEAARVQLGDVQQQVATIVQAMMAQAAENDPEFAEQLQRNQQIQQLVDQRVAPMRQQFEQQQQAIAETAQQAARREQAAESVRQFFAASGIQPGSEEDNAVTQAFMQLRQAGVPLDETQVDHFNLAWEATQNPALAAELMLAPQALQIPGGVARLRERVGATIPPGQGAPQGTTPQTRRPTRRRVEAFVESGSGGAPAGGAPGKRPKDEFDEAWDYWQGQQDRGVIFGSKRT